MKLDLSKITFSIILLYSIVLIGQVNPPKSSLTKVEPSHSPVSFSSKFSFLTGSSAIRNNMLYNLALGGKITNEIIDNNFKKTNKSNNTLGAITSFQFNSFTKNNLKDSVNWNLLSISYNFNNYKGFLFTKDLYSAIFKGNASSLGKTLNFDNSVYANWSDHAIAANFYKKKSFTKRKFAITSFQAGISVVSSYDKIRIKAGNLITDTNGSQIQANFNGYLERSNSANFIKGYSLFGGFSAIYNKINLNVSNLGVAFLTNLKSNSTKTETNITQSSINFKTLNNAAWVSQKRDSIKKVFLPNEGIKNKMVLTPFVVSLSGSKSHTLLGGKKPLDIEAMYLNFSGFLPQLKLSQQFLSLKKLTIYSGIRYGGFGGYSQVDLDVKISHILNNKINYAIQVFALEGLLNSKFRGGGLSLNLSVIL